LIKPKLETSRPDMAQRSSHGALSAKVLLLATLRFLAGGNYIDIVDLYLLPGDWEVIFGELRLFFIKY
jgi:hypothetical protein